MIRLTESQLRGIEAFGIWKLSEQELCQYAYSKGYYDKVFFGDFFLWNLKGKSTPHFHKEIYKALWGEDNINIICPRWHWKTTTVIIDIIHSLVYQLYSSQLYIANAGLWSETLWKIRYELETNLLITKVFWVLVPTQQVKEHDNIKRRWKEKMLELTNWEIIETLSKGNPVRGKRPKRIIVDDIDENKDVMNKMIVEKTRTWFFSSLYNTLLPGGKICILWTIVGTMCMVKYIKDTKQWKTIEYKAVNNWEPLWGDLWSLQALEERKKAIGTTLYNQEFMNIPLQVANTIIKSEHIRYFEYKGENFDKIYIWVDPAISEKTNSDNFAITVCGILWGKKYILESLSLKWQDKDPFKATNTVYNLYKKWTANKVIIETVAFQQVMSKLFKMKGIATQDITPHKDKVTRLLERQGDFEQWLILFNKPTTYSLIDQLLSFPDVEHDDEVDSMVYSFGGKRQEVFVWWF